MTALHLYRVEFTRPRTAGDMQLVWVVAADMPSAIAKALEHRGDHGDISTCARAVTVDAFAAGALTEIALEHTRRVSEVLS